MTQTQHKDKVDGWQKLEPQLESMKELFDKFSQLQKLQMQLNEEMVNLTTQAIQATKDKEDNG